jgi:hypothetical protein
MSQIFIIGIGGTGMRCVEAFVHLCAIGMFDNTDVHLLALDTDRDNGNFTRLKNLKDAYIKTKGVNKPQYALKDTFFSAKLNYYQYSPDYTKISSFKALFGYDDTKHYRPETAAVADLLLAEGTRTFNLLHGYRAQTHLGSLLMYHSIIAEIKESELGGLSGKTAGLRSFIQALIAAATAGKPRVFILGSVFGGTGASSIPIIPKAIKDAASIVAGAIDIEKNAFFGSTLLTSYFSFPIPGENERAQQKIVATSDKFALNSQAAMMFYEADDTVKKTYQKFYMMGTETMEWQPGRNNGNHAVTGGQAQENDSHYIELLAAFAAYDFFNSPEEELESLKSARSAQYLYRTFDENGKINFSDFVNIENKDELARKMGLFAAMSYLALLKNQDFFSKAQTGGLIPAGIHGYEDIDPDEAKNLKRYMELFHFRFENGILNDGWMRQMHRSAGGGDKFLLNPAIFGCNAENEFERFHFNKYLYQNPSDYESHKFGIGLFGSIHDTFCKRFIKTSESENISNKNERLIKRTYDTLCNLYDF